MPLLDDMETETEESSNRLRYSREPLGGIPDAIALPSTEVIERLRFVPDLHNPQSGRLDVKKIADLYGLSLSDVARVIKRDVSTVAKTPDAVAIQGKLAVFEQIAAPLLYLVRTPEHLRMWMNAPNVELEGDTPLTVLREGEGEAVAKLLHDIVVGQPS